MKKVFSDKIVNIDDNLFDNKFIFEINTDFSSLDLKNSNTELIFLSDLLENRKNEEMLQQLDKKPAMYSNVYSPKDELEIFEDICNNAIKNNKKIHIVWITLKEEILFLEKYYEELGFMREDINCFEPDFSKVLISASINIENIMWKWSDYKRMRDKIFFNPPIRESGQVKALFKWINRWVIAWVNIWKITKEKEDFLSNCILEEKILPITFAKVMNYNLMWLWLQFEKQDFIVKY